VFSVFVFIIVHNIHNIMNIVYMCRHRYVFVFTPHPGNTHAAIKMVNMEACRLATGYGMHQVQPYHAWPIQDGLNK